MPCDASAVTTRSSRIADAERKARRQVDLTLDDIRERRVALDARQVEIAELLGCSRQWVSLMERGAVQDLGVLELARLSAAVGLDLSVKAFPGSSVLRDAGQVGVLRRFRDAIDPAVPFRLEVPIRSGDQRSFDAMLGVLPRLAAVEALSRLRDVQAQIRPILRKQEDAGVRILILVVAATLANRRAMREAADLLGADFPLGTRAVMGKLRHGELPTANGLVVI
jgi:transcriptional regulator with XRE-family HTH domain